MTEMQIVDWIIAIEQTIKMWEEYIITRIKTICPLCKLAGHPQNLHIVKCISCIHTSKFGQGIVCMRQKSFQNIGTSLLTGQSRIIQDIIIRQRIGHLKRLADKLSRHLAKMNPENHFVLIR